MPSITYEFEWGFATYDLATEQDQIEQVDNANEYISRSEVTDTQAQDIQAGASIEVTDDGVNVYHEGEVL